MNRGTYSHESPSVLDVRDPYSEFYQGPHHGKHWYLWHPDDIGTAKPMNENEWFKAFQPLLLRVVNSGYGRQLMGIDADLPVIQKISKNALHFYLGEDQWGADFRVGAKWANVIRYRWPEFKRYARFFYDMPNFFTLLNLDGKLVPAHATATYFPDPHTESTSVDGQVKRTGSSESYSALIGGNGTGFDDDDATGNNGLLLSASETTDEWDEYWKVILLFDSSGIGSGQSVSAAVLSTTTVREIDGGIHSGAGWNCVASAPASNTGLAAGDYQTMGTTRFSDTDLTFATNTADSSTYNDFILNSTGRAAVAMEGISKFGWASARHLDYAASSTEPNWITGQNWIVGILWSETGGTSKDPKLYVTYGVASDTQALNGIALGDVQAVNGITVANAQTVNGITF